MRIRRFAAPLGAVVEDFDVRSLGGPGDDADSTGIWQSLNEAFCQHHVLVFPAQTLTPEQQMAFASHWGELVRHPYAGLKSQPDIIELKNHGKRRDVNQHWHSDMTYNTAPPKLTMLYALETPELGGATAFANQISAYQELSAGMRELVDGLKAEHTAAGLAGLYKEDPAQAPRAEHPVVRTHDESQQRALYVCRAFTRKFVNWTKEESDSVLEYLYRHSTRMEYQARHQWRPGDLVMWDNRCLLHYAVHDHGDDARTIHRVQVAGPVPV
jgi:taurine dioxygenase